MSSGGLSLQLGTGDSAAGWVTRVRVYCPACRDRIVCEVGELPEHGDRLWYRVPGKILRYAIPFGMCPEHGTVYPAAGLMAKVGEARRLGAAQRQKGIRKQ